MTLTSIIVHEENLALYKEEILTTIKYEISLKTTANIRHFANVLNNGFHHLLYFCQIRVFVNRKPYIL
jgi:hypothetical protein